MSNVNSSQRLMCDGPIRLPEGESPLAASAMSATTAAGRMRDSTHLPLGRAEQWVVHHVALTHVMESRDPNRPGSPPPWWAVEVATKLERDQPSFTCYEGWRLIDALRSYADEPETPAEDVAAALAITDRLETAFDSPPMATTD